MPAPSGGAPTRDATATRAPGDAAIALAALRFRWPGQAHDTLDIDSLVVERGTRTFLHGPSGSGKTTLLSLIGAVLEPDAGSVHVDGVDLGALSRGGRDVGQQQRVAAARALISRPPVIVADEPTSALDADARETFLELLFAEVAAAGATLVFVSHDRALEPLFDRAIDLAALDRAGRAPDDAGRTSR